MAKREQPAIEQLRFDLGQGEQLSNGLSLKGGRLRANKYNFAPSHSTKLHSDNGTGDSGGTHSSGDSQSGGDGGGGSDSSRGEGRSSSGGNCGTGRPAAGRFASYASRARIVRKQGPPRTMAGSASWH